MKHKLFKCKHTKTKRTVMLSWVSQERLSGSDSGVESWKLEDQQKDAMRQRRNSFLMCPTVEINKYARKWD